MSSYVVKDTELTSVANAIRTKGGTNASLTFPNGFVSAIGNISGGGGGDFSTANAVFNVEFVGYTGMLQLPFLVTVAYIKNNTLMSGFDNENPLTTAANPEIVIYKGVGLATIWIEQEDAEVAYEITQGNADVTINEYGGYDIEFTDDFEMSMTITKQE